MKGGKTMSGCELPELREWIEPPTCEAIGYCVECGKDIYSGEEIWEIHNDWYCENCIDSFHTEAEREEYFDDVI